MSAATMREQAVDTALALLRGDERVAIVLSDISLDRFGDRIADSDRAVNVGIMESTMVGVAAGFAMEGFHPIAHTIAPFLTERAYEQLKVDFGYQDLGGTFISVGASYDYATEGPTHHAPGDIEVLSAIPGFQLLVPGHPAEVDRLMRATYANGVPTYVRTSEAINAAAFEVEPGEFEVVRRGSRATVIAIGPMLDRTLSATEGLDVDVLYATSVNPFDGATLASVASSHPLIVTVEPFYEGTTTRFVVEALAGLAVRVESIGVPRRFISGYGTPAEFDEELELDERSIRRRISSLLPS